MNLRNLIITFLLFCLSTSSFAQKITISKEPAWVKSINYPTSYTIPDKDINNGFAFLLADIQVNIGTQGSYKHYIKKIVSDEGIQNVSEISITYDPSYENLIIHKLCIWRNGVCINKLTGKNFKLIQSEPDISKHLYNGTSEAISFLEDVRKGDIIEYAYSINGFNPIFNDKYADMFYLQGSSPIGRIYHSIIVSKNRKLYFKNFSKAIQPTITEVGNTREYIWQQDNLLALNENDYLPQWYDPYPLVQVSEYDNWSDLIAWAMNLFKVQTPLSPELKAKITELKTQYKTEEDQIVGAIHFVQDQIRYMGVEMGENSHKPHMPNQIFKQRFGDCKDKSLLLCIILKELNIEAYPVFISTDKQQTLSDYLPATNLFNHTVVEIRYNQKKYYIDPTISSQRGRLGEIYFPNYKNGLTLCEDPKNITNIPTHLSGKTEMLEQFMIQDSVSPVALNVTTTFSGNNADDFRAYFASNSRSSIESDYLNFYAQKYPSISNKDSLTMTDNENDNVIVTVEKYEIKKFWKTSDSTKNKIICSFYPQSIRNCIKLPSTTLRSMPIGLYFPKHLVEIIELNTPEKWNVTNENKTVKDNGFEFIYSITNEERKITLLHDYKCTNDYVSVKDVDKYIENANSVINELGYSLTWSTNNTHTASSYNWMMIILVLFFTIICSYGAYRLYKYEPIKIINPSESGLPIGGWLVINCIGLCITPLIGLKTLFTNGYFNLNTWNLLTSPESSTYHPLWAPALLFEIFGNVLLIILTIIIIVLFLQKRAIVPRLMLFFYIYFFLLALGDYLFVIAIPSISEAVSDSTLKVFIKSILIGIIWGSYYILSDRVKKTFVTIIKPATYDLIEDKIAD